MLHPLVGEACGTVSTGRFRTCWESDMNPLNMKRRLLDLKTQFVPRSKHFSSRL